MKLPFESDGRPLKRIHIGGIWTSRTPGVVGTILGSCIAVCLRDPIQRIGGMNHFMLPKASTGNTQGASYGVNSMKLLIDGCISHGAQKCDLEAKVFGGGHVLRMRETEDSVPRINIRFTLDYLQNEGIPIVAHDVGGYAAREVYFFTDSGRALIKRMNKTGLRLEDHSIIQNDELLLELLTTDPAPLLDAHGYRLL